MSRILQLLLSERNRETVVGDLLEEKRTRMSELGWLRAHAWYVLQIVSFVPTAVVARLSHHISLTLLCLFTALSGAWLGAMDLRLRHPGYIGQEGIALTIVIQSVLTLSTIVLRTRGLRMLTMTGTAGILYLSGKALYWLVRGAHFEGYILLIALALAIQATLTWLTLLSRRDGIASGGV